MAQERDYYQILQISRDATLAEIKQAFRHLARQYHPDLNPTNPLASEKFKRIVEAYEFLSEHHGDTSTRFSGQFSLSDEQKAQNLYVRGIRKALERDYQGAINDYTQAIQLYPTFMDAYLKRCEGHYVLGNDRKVLEDCHQMLQFDSACTQAHYYRGRSRYRLGSTQSALKAYHQALRCQPDYALAYYHRALAHHDLKNRQNVIDDLQKAMELFRQQGDLSGYRLSKETLQNLQHQQGIVFATLKLLKLSLKTLITVFLNPGEGLLTAFSQLNPSQAIGIGIIFTILANGCLLFGAYIGWQDLIYFPLLNLILVGLIPFLSLVGISVIARFFSPRSGHFSGDIFIAGTSLLPLGFLTFASGFSQNLGIQMMIILTTFACCYTILFLYHGCLQITQLRESTAAFLAPVMVLISGWFTYSIFQVIAISY